MSDVRVMDVDYENNILAVAAERQIFIWDLRNGELKDILSYPIYHHTKPISCLKVIFFLNYFQYLNHNLIIIYFELKFSPMCQDDIKIRYLVSGAEDGNIIIVLVKIWLFSLIF